MSYDEGMLTQSAEREALEEEKERELEDETVQKAEIVRTTSDPGLPSNREREEHEATHAQLQKLVCCMCERTWNCDEAPQEHWCRKR